eukprot:m.44790 g.44790  ORF g.44790 m.44790 type:complete len:685 (-) comp6213_c0_seq1:168-2222(-)
MAAPARRLVLLCAAVVLCLSSGAAADDACVDVSCTAPSECQTSSCVAGSCVSSNAPDGSDCSSGRCSGGVCVFVALSNDLALVGSSLHVTVSDSAGDFVFRRAREPSVSLLKTLAGLSSGVSALEEAVEANAATAEQEADAARAAAEAAAVATAKTYSDGIEATLRGEISSTMSSLKSLVEESSANATAALELAVAGAAEARDALATTLRSEFATQDTLSSEVSDLRNEISVLEGLLGSQLDALNVTHGENIETALAALVDLDERFEAKADLTDVTALQTRASNLETTVAAQQTLLNAMSSCALQKKFYDTATEQCVSAVSESNAVVIPQTGTCDSNQVGQLLYTTGGLQVCNGENFVYVSLPPLGESDNPALSCEHLFTIRPNLASGVYFLTDENLPEEKGQFYCDAVTKKSRGGHGTTSLLAGESCDFLNNIMQQPRDYYFIDIDGNFETTTDRVRVLCDNGVNKHGDGMSADSPGLNCQNLLSTHGKTASGTYFVNPDGQKTMQIYCDQVTEGGGWNLMMRISGSGRQHVDTNNFYCSSGSIVLPSVTECRLATADISRFIRPAGVQIFKVRPDGGNFVSWYQRAAADNLNWPSVLECSKRTTIIANGDSWILTSYPSLSDAINNSNGDTGDYTGDNHHYPTPYALNQIFFKGGVTGLRANTAFTSSSCCFDNEAGMLWVR